MIKSLKDKKKRIRLQAAQALSKLDAQAATPAFLEFLRDKEENVRSIAAQNLGRSSGRSVVEALVAALKNGTTGLSRRSFGGKALEIVIIEALRSLGDPAAIPELEEALKINKRYGKHIADSEALRSLSTAVVAGRCCETSSKGFIDERLEALASSSGLRLERAKDLIVEIDRNLCLALRGNRRPSLSNREVILLLHWILALRSRFEPTGVPLHQLEP